MYESNNQFHFIWVQFGATIYSYIINVYINIMIGYHGSSIPSVMAARLNFDTLRPKRQYNPIKRTSEAGITCTDAQIEAGDPVSQKQLLYGL